MELINQLSIEHNNIIENAKKAARETNQNIFLVGGAVRDIYLKKGISDLDICVEGDASEFAKVLNIYLKGDIKTYREFLTNTIILPNQTEIDIITTRKEHYQLPGSLPEICAGNIFDDLKRRDFSINAIGLALSGSITGEIIDPTGGIKDLRHKEIRTLHNKSFSDDPTRIIRCIRFAHRLSFNIETGTYKLLIKNIRSLETVSPNRLKGEFIKIISEGKTLKILKKLKQLNASNFLLPGTNLNLLSSRSLNCLKTYYGQNNTFKLWLATLLLIYWQCGSNPEDINKIQWDFTRQERKALEWLVNNKAEINFLLRYNSHASQLHLHRILHNSPSEAKAFLIAVMTDDNNVKRQFKSFKNNIELPLNGTDLLKKGIPPGPLIGRLLTMLEEKVIEGEISTKQEAFQWLKRVSEDVN